jgi:hypothetical protein
LEGKPSPQMIGGSGMVRSVGPGHNLAMRRMPTEESQAKGDAVSTGLIRLDQALGKLLNDAYRLGAASIPNRRLRGAFVRACRRLSLATKV